MASQKPVIHGRDHGPGGSDPITGYGYIAFDIDNIGDSLTIHANTIDFVTSTSGGMSFESSGQDISFRVIGAGHGYNIDADDAVTINSRDASLDFTAGTVVDIEAVTNINLFASAGPVMIQGATQVLLTWNTGGELLVQDGLGADIFRIDDDGALHGKTGKSLVFDL
jgi:hypothetical protein